MKGVSEDHECARTWRAAHEMLPHAAHLLSTAGGQREALHLPGLGWDRRLEMPSGFRGTQIERATQRRVRDAMSGRR